MAPDNHLSSATSAGATHATVVERFIDRTRPLGITVAPVASLAEVAALVASVVAEAERAAGPVVIAPALDVAHPGLRPHLRARQVAIVSYDPDDPAGTFADALVGVGISAATLGVAETGSLVVADAFADRLVRMLSHTHVVVLERSGIVADLDAAGAHLRALISEDSMPYVSFITGPSRTADIEMSLTAGAHGPARLLIALLGAMHETGAE